MSGSVQTPFLSARQVEEIARTDRLKKLLIRWDQGRALVPAQDVVGLIEATERGGWTVRDVQDPAFRMPRGEG